MVRQLPKNQRKKVLTYGLFGAYIFRFIFIGLGMLLIQFWCIKLLGIAYLA
jgi:predicted tellurium resistance membrane protein TerC